jgi:long-subunit acyl-CoA synthetase (AMP-forming)
LDQLATANKFNSLERVKGNFRLVDKEFEVGTILTPTMKLRRNQAKEFFAELIEDIYTNSPDSKP